MLGWMNHKLESRLPEEISASSDMQMITTLMAGTKGELKSLLMKVKGESEKAGLNSTFKKKIMTFGPITPWQIDGETMETMTYVAFLSSRITADCNCGNEIKKLAPWKKSYSISRQHIKKQRDYFADKCQSSKTMVFPIVMYGCESQDIKKAEH